MPITKKTRLSPAAKRFDPDSAGEDVLVRLGDLVRPSYQRENTKPSAQKVGNADTFNPKLLGRITVADTPGQELHDGDTLLVPEGKPVYDLVDGLQRCTGLLALFGPDTEVPAVYHPDIDRSEQIEMYVSLNRGQVRVSDWEIFKARLIGNAPGAVMLHETFAAEGFTLGSSTSATGVSSHGQVQAFTGYSYLKGGDPSPESLEALRQALAAVNQLWPKENDSTASRQRTNSAAIFGLARVFRDATDVKTGSRPKVKLVVDKLMQRKITPGTIITEASELRTSGVTLGGGDHLTLNASRAILGWINKGNSVHKFTAPWATF